MSANSIGHRGTSHPLSPPTPANLPGMNGNRFDQPISINVPPILVRSISLCSAVDLPATADDAPEWIHILPPGEISTGDGPGRAARRAGSGARLDR